jgi:hypothetical protein
MNDSMKNAAGSGQQFGNTEFPVYASGILLFLAKSIIIFYY